MRNLFFYLIVFLICTGFTGNGYGQEVYPIADVNFYNFLQTFQSDLTDGKGNIYKSKANEIRGTLDCSDRGISNLDGLQLFTKIDELIAHNNNLAMLPELNSLTNLTVLHVSDNRLTQLPVLENLINLQQLIVYNNQLSSLPDLSHNIELQQITAFNNKISSLPPFADNNKLTILELGQNNLKSISDLGKLAGLKKLFLWKNQITNVDLYGLSTITTLNLSDNKLTSAPSLSSLKYLDTLYLDKNQLSSLPSFNSNPNLSLVKTSENNLSFEDFLPLTTIFNFETIFEFSVQNKITITGPSDIKGNAEIILKADIENAAGNVYSWYKNGILFKTTETSAISIDSTDAGPMAVISVEVINKNSALKSLKINSENHRLITSDCIDQTGIQYIISEYECVKGASISFNTTALNTYGYKAFFEMTPSGGQKKYSSVDNKIESLLEPVYQLRIISSAGCSEIFERNIILDTQNCNDFVITPDNDGYNDSYFFQEQGKADIYNAQGKLIRRLSLPAEWNGADESGQINSGYYSVKINKDSKLMYFTVFF